MMEDTWISGPDFDGLHPARGGDGHRQDEIPENLLPVGGKGVRLPDAEDEVGRTELPLIAEPGRLRRAGDRTQGRALADPVLNELDLGGGQAAFFGEIAVAGLGKPRRHVAAFGYRGNLGGVTFHVVIVEEREWRCFTGPMTGRAVMVHDGSDLLIEGNRGSGDCGQGKRHED